MVKLFTHTDLDGIGCAILAKIAFKNCDIEYCGYNNVNENVTDFVKSNGLVFNACFITDISVSEDTANLIDEMVYANRCCPVKLFDHHATEKRLNSRSWCRVNELNPDKKKTCGTEMFFNYLLSEGYLNRKSPAYLSKVSEFVEYVRQYDTWDWSLMGEAGLVSKQINDLFDIYSYSEFTDWCLDKFGKEEPFGKFSEMDKFLLTREQKTIDNYVASKDKLMQTGYLGKYKCGFVFADKYISEVGHKLCNLHPDIDVVVLINMNGRVSFRSEKEGVDVGKDLASLFGGGGHKGAAGSEFDKDELTNMVLKNLFKDEISFTNEIKTFDEADKELDTR